MVQGQKLDVIQFISPFTAFIRQTWFQTFLVLVALVLISNSCFAILSFGNYGSSSFHMYRLSFKSINSQTSWNITNTEKAKSCTFMLTSKGCVSYRSIFAFDDVYNKYATFVTTAPASIDGFSLLLNLGENTVLFGRFILEGSDNNATWELCGGSNIRLVPDGIRDLGISSSFMPLDSLHYDFRPPWPLFCDVVVDPVLFAIGCICTAACGVLNKQTLAKSSFVCCAVLLASNAVAAAAGYSSLGLAREAYGPLAQSLVYLSLALSLVLLEARFFDVMCLAGCFGLAINLIENCALFDDCAYSYDAPPIQAISFLVVRRACQFRSPV